MSQPARATSVETLGAKFAMTFSEETLQHGLALKLRPSDVVITPFGKSGTTWLQQIVHCLRTAGDMDFDDISRVVPWIETSGALGINLDAEQKANPRAFKSHLAWGEVPQGGRYIVAIRDPKDALYSLYRFIEGWFFEAGSISLDDFAREFFIKDRGYWKHLGSWWPRRDDDDVLLMAFEHMKLDLSGTIERVADFIGIKLDDELKRITEQQASLKFMQEHSNRFDDRLMREMSERVASLPAGSDSAKVRVGSVGEHVQHLSDDISAEVDAIWQQEISARFGFPDYQALIDSLN
jgi:aryl sulfotransferase